MEPETVDRRQQHFGAKNTSVGNDGPLFDSFAANQISSSPIRRPGAMTAHHILQLQQTIGNQAVMRMLKRNRTIQRDDDDQNQMSDTQDSQSNGCRKVTETPCPGTKGQVTQIDYAPQMLLVNVGTCPLFVDGVDGSGKPMAPTGRHFSLQPSESKTFVPEQGSSAVGFACTTDCDGVGRLEHPYNCA